MESRRSRKILDELRSRNKVNKTPKEDKVNKENLAPSSNQINEVKEEITIDKNESDEPIYDSQDLSILNISGINENQFVESEEKKVIDEEKIFQKEYFIHLPGKNFYKNKQGAIKALEYLQRKDLDQSLLEICLDSIKNEIVPELVEKNEYELVLEVLNRHDLDINLKLLYIYIIGTQKFFIYLKSSQGLGRDYLSFDNPKELVEAIVNDEISYDNYKYLSMMFSFYLGNDFDFTSIDDLDNNLLSIEKRIIEDYETYLVIYHQDNFIHVYSFGSKEKFINSLASLHLAKEKNFLMTHLLFGASYSLNQYNDTNACLKKIDNRFSLDNTILYYQNLKAAVNFGVTRLILTNSFYLDCYSIDNFKYLLKNASFNELNDKNSKINILAEFVYECLKYGVFASREKRNNFKTWDEQLSSYSKGDFASFVEKIRGDLIGLDSNSKIMNDEELNHLISDIKSSFTKDNYSKLQDQINYLYKVNQLNLSFEKVKDELHDILVNNKIELRR